MQSTEGLSAMEKFSVLYEEKKKSINTALAVIVLAVGGFFAYKYLVAGPKEEKAALKMMRAEQYYAMDSLNLALNGDAANPGFLRIIKQFDGSANANLAHYYAASCYMKMGDSKSALKHLQDFDAHGTIFEHPKAGLLGDIYMESNDTKKAIDQYKTATADADDDVFTPMYLQRLAIAYEKSNQTDEAIKAYKRIRDEYPRSPSGRDVEKALAQLGVLD
ncbi:MAG: tetratricopeptide repeat protein [Chitinophagaceae bacterium]